MFFSAKRRRTTRAGFPARTAYGSTSAATTLAAVTDRHAREHNSNAQRTLGWIWASGRLGHG
jgi:hypothetical protein